MTLPSMGPLSMPNQIVPLAGIAGGSATALSSVWLGALHAAAGDALLARAVADFPLTNTELLAAAKLEKFKPPQSWYDEDQEGLY